MKIAIVAAGFSPSEADKLRRAMATFRRSGTIHGFRDKFIAGMTGRGYERDFAERCFRQIEGFADYGFPESHAASFALLVYVSAWIKCHYPAAFACALMNSQPMGFYAPAQIIGDARRHGVEVLPVDVNHSGWDCTLEPLLRRRSRCSVTRHREPRSGVVIRNRTHGLLRRLRLLAMTMEARKADPLLRESVPLRDPHSVTPGLVPGVQERRGWPQRVRP